MVVAIGADVNKTVAEPLTATIDANSTNSPVPATIEFAGNATGGSAPYSYSWNFGDGNNSTYFGSKVPHAFDKAGNYIITLSAKDSGTPSQNASANVVVAIGADVNKTVAQTETVAEPLTATIDANGTNSPVPATIEFAGNATGGLAPYSYSWNFGDGNNSTYFGSKVPHAFDKAGNYIITLSAKDSGIPSQNASANVVVAIGADVNKTVAQTETVAEPLTANIYANSTSGLGANGTKNNSSQFDILAANVTTVSDPAKVESGTNSTSMIRQHTEPKLQLQKPPEFPRTADKNITFVSKNADKSNSTNHVPHADDQSVIIDGNKATNIVLKGIDQDNDKIKFDVVSEPLMGVLAGFDKNSGTVMYVPNPGSDGTDRFTFRAVDIHNLQSNVAEVLVIINAIQDTGPKLADVNAATSSDEPVIITVKASNHESGSYFKFNAVSGPSHGKLTKFTNIDYDTAIVKYTPDEDYSGNDMFDFRAFDTSSGSTSLSDIATASITVIEDPLGKNPLPLGSPQSSDTDVTSIAGRVSSNGPIIKDKPVMNNEPEQAKSQSSTLSTNPIIINNNPSVNAGLDRSVYEGTNRRYFEGYWQRYRS